MHTCDIYLQSRHVTYMLARSSTQSSAGILRKQDYTFAQRCKTHLLDLNVLKTIHVRVRVGTKSKIRVQRNTHTNKLYACSHVCESVCIYRWKVILPEKRSWYFPYHVRDT